jgi:predicted RNA-binding protein Jag
MEVNDYLQAKEEKLLSYVQSKIDLVERTGKDFRLPYMSSYDRKKVHAFVSELGKAKIYTKSIGEGPERRLHICKKDEIMTIDAE